MKATDGQIIHAIPQWRTIVGTVEGPELFAVGFNTAIEEFLEKRTAKECASDISFQLPYSTECVNGTMSVYADDTYTTRVVASHTADEAMAILALDDMVFDEVMREGGCIQNESTREVVPSLCSKTHNKR